MRSGFSIVSSLQIQEKLTAAISSGESPDLVDYADNTFPLLMSKNMYTPLMSIWICQHPSGQVWRVISTITDGTKTTITTLGLIMYHPTSWYIARDMTKDDTLDYFFCGSGSFFIKTRGCFCVKA